MDVGNGRTRSGRRGFTLIELLLVLVVIGVVTAAMSVAGLRLGARLGARFGHRMEIIGGAILVFSLAIWNACSVYRQPPPETA